MRDLFGHTTVTRFRAQTAKMVILYLLIVGGTSDVANTAQPQRPQSKKLGSTTRPSNQQRHATSNVSADGNIAPIRIVEDRYPMFAGVGVDPVNDKAVFGDDNTRSLLTYDRAVPGDSRRITEYREKLGGPKTGRISHPCGIAMDPVSKEIYMVNTDFTDDMLVFSYGQSGNVSALRELSVDHGSSGVSLDRDHNELFMTVQHLNKIAVYRATAQGEETTLRFIQGPKTGLVDPHGIFVDNKNDEIVVTNHHSSHEIETGVLGTTLNFRYMLQSSGRFVEASITVYSRTAQGNAVPLRTIQGPKTRLDLPLGVAVDAEKDLIAVANDQTNSILFFSRTAQGNVAPLDAIEGPATGLKNPGGIYIDLTNNEIWVTNWGDHNATIYARSARGNVAPLRTIRTAPQGEPVSGLGGAQGLAWDSRRDEILVPN